MNEHATTSYDRAGLANLVAQRAQLLDTADSDKCVEAALGLIADNLSEYGTETFAGQLPEGYRPVVLRHLDKVEHSQQEMIEMLATAAGIGPAAADDVLYATLQSLYEVVSEDECKRIVAQLPYDVAHVFRSARPGSKRGTF